MSENADGQPNTLTRYHAFIRKGWMAVLSPTAKDVWHAFNSHASVDSIAWPGPATIAQYCKHSSGSHIRRARAELVAMGLLVLVDPGGGRFPAKFKVCVPDGQPDTLRETRARSESALGPKSRMHPTRNSRRHPAPNPRRDPTRNSRTEESIEESNEESNNHSGKNVVESLIYESERLEAVTGIVNELGIKGANRSRVIEDGSIYPAHLLLLALDAVAAHTSNPTGYILNHLEDWIGKEICDVYDVSSSCRSDRITSIRGIAVTTKAGGNSYGIFLNPSPEGGTRADIRAPIKFSEIRVKPGAIASIIDAAKSRPPSGGAATRGAAVMKERLKQIS